MATKRKRTDYSLDTKYKSIQDIVKGVKSRTQIVNELGVPKSTLARWTKDKDKIFSSYINTYKHFENRQYEQQWGIEHNQCIFSSHIGTLKNILLIGTPG